jgi:ketosteroid isomerase-like protein
VSVDAIRAAYEALGDGDVEPLVALIAPELEWRGRRSPWRFWRQPPS